jgi:hypothetical protein
MGTLTEHFCLTKSIDVTVSIHTAKILFKRRICQSFASLFGDTDGNVKKPYRTLLPHKID